MNWCDGNVLSSFQVYVYFENVESDIVKSKLCYVLI